MSKPRILIAGIGNIFLGDDGFGVEVAQRLANRTLPELVRVVDFGIRGFDLTYALLDGYETVIWVDASPRGGKPGDLYVIEPDVGQVQNTAAGPPIEAHRMDPLNVLRFLGMMGGRIGRLLLVACEPTALDEWDDIHPGLSRAVEQAVEPAISLIEDLVSQETRRIRDCTPVPERDNPGQEAVEHTSHL